MVSPIKPGDVQLSSWNIIINVTTEVEKLVGFDDGLKTSRLSTAIVYFDEALGVGLTFSGSFYSTFGPPGNLRSETIYLLKKRLRFSSADYKFKYPIQTKIRSKSHFTRLYLHFPIIYRGHHERRYPLNKEGMACGNGWFNLIYKLSRDIETIAKQLSADGSDENKLPKVIQVKQKFGGLRLYMVNQTRVISALIEEAQKASFEICETCGQPGKAFSDDGWFRTVCESCKANKT